MSERDSERAMTKLALASMDLKEARCEAHSHACELSARVDALEERVRILYARYDEILLSTPIWQEKAG